MFPVRVGINLVIKEIENTVIQKIKIMSQYNYGDRLHPASQSIRFFAR
jgi:hypothetical protein